MHCGTLDCRGFCWPSTSKADTFSFNLGVGNPAISGYPGPYVSVTVNRTNSTHATITFTSLTAAGNIYLMETVERCCQRQRHFVDTEAMLRDQTAARASHPGLTAMVDLGTWTDSSL